jgi:hypothetical protein
MCDDLPKVTVVCEDDYKYLRRFHTEYDKIAIDVFEGYGHNNEEHDYQLSRLFNADRCPRKKVWCWGAANIGENPETKGQWWY